MNLGVDVFMKATPSSILPSIGLRPGGERPDLETVIPTLYLAMYEAIAAHSQRGLNTVVDVGHHDSYSVSLDILPQCARCVRGLPVLFVGVHCPIDIIMKRRHETGWNTESSDGWSIPRPVQLWQSEVHRHYVYDLELDTSLLTPQECAEKIRQYLASGIAPTAFQRIEK